MTSPKTALLWIRKIVVYLLVTAIVLGLVLYFIVNSALVVRKVADTYAPDYNISYSRIHGNVLTGVMIEDLAYKSDRMAKHITLKWNPSGLFKKTLMVNTLRVEKVNVDTIKALVASFASVENNESEETSSSEPIDIGVKVDHLALTLDPFVEQGITISDVVLDMHGLRYKSERVDVRQLDLKVDTNVTDIVLDASLKDGRVKIKELNITEVDALALQTLFAPDSNESNESAVEVIAETNATEETPGNPLIPKWVQLDKLNVTLLPLVYDPVNIKQLNIHGGDALFDVEKLLLEKADLNLDTSTNLSDIGYKTKVKNNKLIGKVNFKPKKALFKLYELPIRREAIGEIVFDLQVSEKEIITDLHLKMEQLLKGDKDAFNLDIENLKSHAVYDIKEGSLKAESELLLTTPYAKEVLITNLFTMDQNISYSGEIHAPQVIGVDAKFVKPLDNLQITYEGNSISIKTDIASDNLQGTFTSSDFKTAALHLENKEPLVLNTFIELPAELNQSNANITIDAPLSFEENASITAFAKIDSNLLNIDTNISYKDRLQIKSISHIPEESLLRAYSDELKWNSLNPITSEVALSDNRVDALLTAGTVKANAQYDLNTTKVDGKVQLGGLNANVSGILEEKITVDTKINSMNALIESVNSIYTLGEVPGIKGSAELSVELTEMKSVDISLKSPEVIYEADAKTQHIVNDIDLAVNLQDQQVVLNRYTLSYGGQKLYSTKPSKVLMNDTNVTITPLWLNDQLKVEGAYDLKMRKGTINAEAEKLQIAHEIIDLDSKIDLKTVLDGNKTSVNGEITLLGGNIYYDLGQKTYASDSDILIVQDMKEKEASTFMDNLSVAVQVKTKKPLIYKKGAVDIQAAVDLSVYKAEFSELMVLGSVEILKGGSYTFEGKQFVLDKSFVHFTGNPNKPLIEASVKYESLNHLITIMVTGSADSPNINFSSKPALSKEQILSIILFDSEGGAGTNSSEDMMKMMGGAMAKSALSNLGVQIDHLVLGADNSVEVGKRLTDEITIIYINDEIPSVKLKYEHSRRTESVFGVSEESQSYDILYKRDY